MQEEILIPIFLFLCIAGVSILRPITKRLGLLLEAMAREKMEATKAPTDAHSARLTHQLDQVSARLELMEDRVEFVEKLLESRSRGQVPGVD